MQENCLLRFLIFKLLSQRFFDLKLAISRFFKISKKCKIWQFWPPNCGRFMNTWIKVNRWKMILGPCTLKLILSIFFVGPFVFAQFWAIASIISWSVQTLILYTWFHHNWIHILGAILKLSVTYSNVYFRQKSQLSHVIMINISVVMVNWSRILISLT